jgi:hypothetical protein
MAISKYKDVTRYVLETRPYTRNSDNYLYLEVIAFLGERMGANIKSMSLADVMNLAENGQIPGYDTIARLRRKVQDEDPDLMCERNIRAMRMEWEKEIREWARG